MIITIFFDTLIPYVASPSNWGCICNLGDCSCWVVPEKVELLSCGKEGLMVVLGCGEKIESEDGQRIRFERGAIFYFLFFVYWVLWLSGFKEKKIRIFVFFFFWMMLTWKIVVLAEALVILYIYIYRLVKIVRW